MAWSLKKGDLKKTKRQVRQLEKGQERMQRDILRKINKSDSIFLVVYNKMGFFQGKTKIERSELGSMIRQHARIKRLLKKSGENIENMIDKARELESLLLKVSEASGDGRYRYLSEDQKKIAGYSETVKKFIVDAAEMSGHFHDTMKDKKEEKGNRKQDLILEIKQQEIKAMNLMLTEIKDNMEHIHSVQKEISKLTTDYYSKPEL